MKKNKLSSRICAVVLSLVFLLGMLPMPALADGAAPVAPTISTDLSTTPVTCYQNAYLTRLSAKASTTDGGTISYQWYSGTDSSNVNTPISGATTYRYRPATDTAGTTYYRLIATNTLNGQTAAQSSAVACVTVSPMTLNVSVTQADDTPVPADGYQYNSGDTATTLKATGTAVAPGNDVSAGTWSYYWYAVSSNGDLDDAPGENDQQTYTPPAVGDGSTQYVCCGTFTLNGISYDYNSVFSAPVSVKVFATSAQAPTFSEQPVGKTYLVNTSAITALTAEASVSDGGTVTYQWYVSTDNQTFTPVSGATSTWYSTSYTPPTETAAGTYYYRCVAINTLNSASGHTYTSTTNADASLTFKTVVGAGGTWAGDGTADSPYLITNADDLLILQNLVNTQGFSFQGYTFKLIHDITLPSGWVPIGGLVAGQRGESNGVNILPFSGTLDGGSKTITVPAGGLPLFGYVRFAAVKNLNLYGVNIAGYGLVNNYCVDYGPTGDYGDWTATATYPDMPTTIVIDNVTLKSGSSTRQSGFIGGYASGADTVYIRNCKVESGVTIGSSKDQSDVGSFGGAFNGYVENSVSYATVYGVNRVGGLIGSKGQSMGNSGVQDSAFYGAVIATGNYAGGIFGSGYASPSAPNTPCVSVQNCFVTGTVTGLDYVGGILGAEPAVKCNWANGIGYIQNNSFTGTVTATKAGGTANIGGIIGAMNSLDRYNIISNNYYLNSCGAEKGIGAIPTVIGMTNTHFGRADDPAGADADKLSKSATSAQFSDGTVTAALNSGINSSGNWVQNGGIPGFGTAVHLRNLLVTGYKSIYHGGDSLDLSALKAYATYSDGTVKSVDIGKISIVGFDSDLSGYCTVTATYDNHTCIFETQIAENADYTDDVAEAKTAVSGAAYAFPMGEANTSDGVKTLIENEIASLGLNGISATVTMGSFTPAVAGTPSGQDGTNGAFSFTVALSKGHDAANVSDSVEIQGTVAAATIKVSQSGGGWQASLGKSSLTGGDVTASLGNVNIAFPGNVLKSLVSDGTLTLSQQPLSASQLSAINSALPQNNAIVCSFNLNLADANGAQIHSLGGKITVTMKLTDDELAKITDAGTAILYYYDTNTGKLVKMDATFDLKDKTVTFTTDHLSTFVVAQGTSVPDAPSPAPIPNPHTGDSSNGLPVEAVLLSAAALATLVCLRRRCKVKA